MPSAPTSAQSYARALTYAGAIPFVIGTIIVVFGPPTDYATYRNLMITYAVVIGSFLGGIQWGVALANCEAAPTSARNLFFISVLPSLFAWTILFIPRSEIQLLAAIMLFASVWAFDALLALQKLIPGWFFRLRSIISGIVIFCLLVVLVCPRLL
jgi:Protein of unknown function (DUF3429)